MKQATTASIILLLIFTILASAQADLTSVRVMVGTREAMLSPQAVFDGVKVMVPLSIADALRITCTAEGSNKIKVTNALGHSETLNTTLVNGVQMVPVAKLAEAVGLGCSWDAPKRTVTLTAKLKSVEFVDNTLKVNCTIPVNYKIVPWTTGGKLSLDVFCTQLDTPAKEVLVGGNLVDKLRLGEPDETTARVAMDLVKPASYKITSQPFTANITVSVSSGKGGATPVSKPEVQPQEPIDVSQVKVEPIDDESFRLIMITSARGSVKAALSTRPAKITLTLPSSKLSDVADSITGSHKQLSSIKVSQDPSNETVKIDMALKRVMVYDTKVFDGSIAVTVRPPLKSGGKLSGKTVLIDPGHGNLTEFGKIDTGATCAGVCEKDVNLQIANTLADELKDQGAKVIVSRTGDDGLSLDGRPQLAASSRVDFFISIHCNSNLIPESASGLYTYYHASEPSPMLLAQCIQENACRTSGMCNMRVLSDQTRYNIGFAVLRGLTGTGIPGVLIECGFINNSSDRAKLTDPDFQKKLAQGITTGLKQYIEGK